MKETFILVMPSFNEGARIKKTLESWIKVVKKVPGSEILIVDGNSTDDTPVTVNSLSKKYKFIKLVQKQREGYGKDLIYGYNLATKTKHKWIFQTDTDGPFDPNDFFKLWKARTNSPLILGRRHKRKDPLYRLALAAIIQLFLVILYRKLIKDPNVPFRLIRKDYLKKVVSKIPSSTIAPNIFLSIIALSDGHDLQNIPVKHYFRYNNKNAVRILRGALKGFWELSSFKAN